VLFAAFKSLGQQFLVISGLVLVCALVAWLFDGRQAAIGLIDTAVVGMKGPWVWTFGFGLASFVSQRGRRLPLDINGVLAPNEVTAALTGRVERSTRHRNAYAYTIPITLLGLFLTSAYGIPNWICILCNLRWHLRDLLHCRFLAVPLRRSDFGFPSIVRVHGNSGV
jgi:hypothetical protein